MLRLFAAACLLTLWMPLSQAAAQTAPATPSAEPTAPSAVLPEVVVEGEKITRTLADTTTSIGVTTGQQIRDQQITDLQDALNQTANVVAPEGNRGNSGFSIRGLNSEGLTQGQNAAEAPLISINIDGATQNAEATRRGARALWDVEQIEVLRGPQSTLQARNALAGSVFIKTNDPTYLYEGIIEGTLAQNNTRSGAFVVNVPIVADQMALRVSGITSEGDKGIRYADPRNDDLDDDQLANVRGKLLIEPKAMPGLSALFTVARTEDRPAVNSVTGPDFFDRVFGLSTNGVEFRETASDNYISDVSYEVAPGIKLRSITALAETETDIGTSAGATFLRDDLREGEDFTQDMRLEIEPDGNGISGVVGLFYGEFENANDSRISQDFSADLGLPDGTLPFIAIQNIAGTNRTESLAAYADLRWRFLDDYQLIGGGRLLRDTVRSRQQGEVLDFGALFGSGEVVQLPIDEQSEAEFEEFLPKAGATYDLRSNQTVGFTYSRGYRAGFTEVRTNGALNEVAPEFLDSYELSYRSTWFDKQLELNANVFHYDYTSQQVAVDDPLFPSGTFIVNAGQSEADGGEIEVRWRPTREWQLFATLGLIDTQFEDLVTAGGDFSGNEFPEAPTVTFATGGLYKDPTGWFAGANLRYIDGYYSFGDLANTALREVDDYTVVDARIGYEWDRVKLTVFAKNLLDNDYLTGLSRDFSGDGVADEATIGDERVVGVTLTGRF